MQEDSKTNRKRFFITFPAGYKPNREEIANALYLLGNFGFCTTHTDWLLDQFDPEKPVVEFLESCCKRLEERHGPINDRVYEMVSTWFSHTKQEDRTHRWRRPEPCLWPENVNF